MVEPPSKRARQEPTHDWSDYCAECHRRAGALLCCDHCPRSYHLGCLGYRSMPNGEWSCPGCVAGQSGMEERFMQTKLELAREKKEHLLYYDYISNV